MIERWRDVRAQGRAVTLGHLGVRPRGGLAAAYEGRAEELFEFLLGLRAALPVTARDAAALGGPLSALNVRLAARLRIVREPDGTLTAHDGHPVGRPIGDRPAAASAAGRVRGISADEHALLGGHPPAGRSRLAPEPPLVVLPTAGRAADVRDALAAHCAVMRRYGHAGLTVVVADDAPAPAAARALDEVCAWAGLAFGFEVIRFGEWAAGGGAGPKRVFRRRLTARPDVPRACAERTFAPGLPGTANAIFAAFAGRDVVWLEQDAAPWAPVTRDRPGGGPRTFVDVMDGAPADAGEEPVDVVHVIDRLAYAAHLEADPVEEQVADYEDTTFTVLGRPSSGRHPLPGMVHFHTCGHPDFRARASHHLVLDPRTPEPARRSLLSGGLPMRRLLADPPPTVSLRRWTSAFGTAVGLPAGRMPGPPTMWATSARLVDVAVGDLMQAFGVPGCVAGTGLRHSRGTVTDSGRGELSSYLFREEILWPLLHAAREALEEAAGGPGYAGRLRTAGDAVAGRAGRGGIVPPALGRVLRAELLADIRRARRSPHPDVRAYGEALAEKAGPTLPGPWQEYHARLEATAVAELLHYADQLRFWASLVDGGLIGEGRSPDGGRRPAALVPAPASTQAAARAVPR
ncbi:hypothetical protein AGRA3207_003279 [Actinomadura graeca]|uniref:Uncharacterized protein n=1 Tax=Actinomadura graeca TaxID=2750812 RepID=A0ABX8QX42_9ACTN|nr:hypothetical protein [Actinomadura graeca]QXJ22297.1 hypothetical protein AGRA3207_003279 [Actinomadura graeca]